MLEHLTTEQRNPDSMELDRLSVEEILELMNREDQKVLAAVHKALPQIGQVVEQWVQRMPRGGRLIYLGAGTSGRIGQLDAVECPPTFGLDPSRVVGILAGQGDPSQAKEEAEDSPQLGRQALLDLNPTPLDLVVGLAASGRTPFVIGALEAAAQAGAATACIVCNPDSPIARMVQFPIQLDCGPEVLTGSTRLKAGTAQKMVCNMITTAAMVRLGKTYQNLMVDLDVSNEKLYHRWLSIVQTASGCTLQQAQELYRSAHHNAKAAICMARCGLTYPQAVEALDRAGGMVRQVLAQKQ